MSPFQYSRIALISYLIGLLVYDYFYPAHWLFYLVPILLFVILVMSGSATLSHNFFIKTYTHPDLSDKQIALTFDDGPDPQTEKVLDILKAHGVKATFFCIGHKIEKYPKIMERIVAEGHLIGNHSYSHSNVFPFYRKKRIEKEIEKTSKMISSYTDKPCDIFRPPFGVMSLTIANAVKSTGHNIIGWNLRSFDTAIKDKNKVINNIKKKLTPGTVLLLHDNRKGAETILEAILQYAHSVGYIFVDVQRIFKMEKP